MQTLMSELAQCRSPHGERGLKLRGICRIGGGLGSLSSRRAWIEISAFASCSWRSQSLSSRRAWIEIYRQTAWFAGCPSLPARGVWIEMSKRRTPRTSCSSRSPQGECGLKFHAQLELRRRGGVAPRKGSVD